MFRDASLRRWTQSAEDCYFRGCVCSGCPIFEIIGNTAAGKGGEIQLTDALLQLLKEEAMYAYNFEGRRYDVGDKLGYLQATVEYALRKPELREGFIEYLENTIKNL